MGDARPATQFEQIVDKESHDAIVNKPNQAANIPIVIVVTSSTPNSKTLLSDLVQLSQSQSLQSSGLRWYEMELTDRTTPMIKFGPQNCPIVILMKGVYCETLLGVRGVDEVERKVMDMLNR